MQDSNVAYLVLLRAEKAVMTVIQADTPNAAYVNVEEWESVRQLWFTCMTDLQPGYGLLTGRPQSD